jgi:hypothetical protein
MTLTFDAETQAFIDGYDLKDYNIWNSEGRDMTRLRKTLRDYLLPHLKYRCCYCQQRKTERHGLTWDIEHIAPKSLYPQFLFSPNNLAISCKECNIAKGEKNTLSRSCKAIYPENSSHFLIVHPYYDTYSDHIEIVRCGDQQTYRVKNPHKGKSTYMMCDLIRFDFAFAEWESFGDTLTQSLLQSIDSLGPDATGNEIKKVIPLAVKLATH